MNKPQFHPANRIRVSLQDKVERLLKNKAQSHQVTFMFHDKTTIVQQLTDIFLKGKKAHIVIEDLKCIQHDLGAKYFSI